VGAAAGGLIVFLVQWASRGENGPG
jgi:hypothetical protein